MTDPVSFKVEGTDAAKSVLMKAQRDILERVEQGVLKATQFMKGEVVQSIAGNRSEHSSVDTGHFMDTIGHKSKSGIGEVYSLVKYAPYLEYGTSRISPRMHFRNSLERNRGKIRDIIEGQVEKKVTI